MTFCKSGWVKINSQEDILQNSEFLQKNGRGRWCDTYVQNSAFYQNSGRVGYICKQPVFGNVFVLTQAKMYLLNFEFWQKKMGGGHILSKFWVIPKFLSQILYLCRYISSHQILWNSEFCKYVPGNLHRSTPG